MGSDKPLYRAPRDESQPTFTPSEQAIVDLLKVNNTYQKVTDISGSDLVVYDNPDKTAVSVEVTIASGLQHKAVARAMEQIGEHLKAHGVSCTLDAGMARCGCADQTISLACKVPSRTR